MKIDPIIPAPLGKPQQGPTQNLVEAIGRDFSAMLDEVNRLKVESGQKVEEFATTPEKDIHGTLIAMERASISMELLLKVRSKMIDAYHEVTRMQF